MRARNLAPVLLVLGTSGPGAAAAGHHYDYSPSWSPDGRHVLFSRDERTFLVGRDGKHVRAVADEMGTAAWSPDGRAIVYGSYSDIWLIAANGSARHRLTKTVARSRDDPNGRPTGARSSSCAPTARGATGRAFAD
jgi:Tol biopolymer transport system component